MDNLLNSLLIFLLVTIVIFFIARELVCWYWKINRIVELLESIDRKLSKNNGLSKNVKSKTSLVNGSLEKESIDFSEENFDVHTLNNEDFDFCYHCGAELEKGAKKCTSCNKNLR